MGETVRSPGFRVEQIRSGHVVLLGRPHAYRIPEAYTKTLIYHYHILFGTNTVILIFWMRQSRDTHV